MIKEEKCHQLSFSLFFNTGGMQEEIKPCIYTQGDILKVFLTVFLIQNMCFKM